MVVSAALSPRGSARRAISTARLAGVIALSDAVFTEISDVLRRPKFARLLNEDRRLEIMALLAVAAIWVEPTDRIEDCRDPKDNIYLDLALAAGADAILSGDDDLLALHPWRSIPIIRPADFLLKDDT